MRLKTVCVLLGILAAFCHRAGEARAADTMEPLGPGLSDAELYAGYSIADETFQIEAVIGAGLTESVSFFLLRGFEIADAAAPNAGVLEVGLLHNLVDTARFELDVIGAIGFELRHFSGASRICVGSELNLDWDRFGFYSRLLGSIDEGLDGALVPSLSALLGARLLATERSELLVELGTSRGFRGLEEASVGLGFNIAPAPWLELIPEAAYVFFPGEDSGTFRLLLGAIFTF